MADPRQVAPNQRRANHSPLMQGLLQKGQGVVYNACPFGCQDHELDENGYCGHLVGFYNGGQTYEPRVRRRADKRVIVSGKARKPMEKGFKLVRITTTARVYSPTIIPDLVVKRNEDEVLQEMFLEEERKLLAAADQVRNPVLDGEWDESPYARMAPAAAATE